MRRAFSRRVISASGADGGFPFLKSQNVFDDAIGELALHGGSIPHAPGSAAIVTSPAAVREEVARTVDFYFHGFGVGPHYRDAVCLRDLGTAENALW